MIRLKKLYSIPTSFDPIVFYSGINIILFLEKKEGFDLRFGHMGTSGKLSFRGKWENHRGFSHFNPESRVLYLAETNKAQRNIYGVNKEINNGIQ